MKKRRPTGTTNAIHNHSSSRIIGYSKILSELSTLLESARRTSARQVNSIMTVTYWELGRRIVEYQQKGKRRAGYALFLSVLSTRTNSASTDCQI